MKYALAFAALFMTASLCISAEVSKAIEARASEMKWTDGPSALPPGAKMIVLEGDMKEPGAFTFRIKVPDGYKIPPHFHPGDEHITVISGTLFLGHGDQFDKAQAREFDAGSFAVMPKGHHHFAFTKGETIVQIHGMGPWGITYVNPSDDPRSKV